MKFKLDQCQQAQTCYNYLTSGEVIHFLCRECPAPDIEVSDVVGGKIGTTKEHLVEGIWVSPVNFLQNVGAKVVLLPSPRLWLGPVVHSLPILDKERVHVLHTGPSTEMVPLPCQDRVYVRRDVVSASIC